MCHEIISGALEERRYREHCKFRLDNDINEMLIPFIRWRSVVVDEGCERRDQPKPIGKTKVSVRGCQSIQRNDQDDLDKWGKHPHSATWQTCGWKTFIPEYGARIPKHTSKTAHNHSTTIRWYGRSRQQSFIERRAESCKRLPGQNWRQKRPSTAPKQYS